MCCAFIHSFIYFRLLYVTHCIYSHHVISTVWIYWNWKQFEVRGIHVTVFFIIMLRSSYFILMPFTDSTIEWSALNAATSLRKRPQNSAVTVDISCHLSPMRQHKVESLESLSLLTSSHFVVCSFIGFLKCFRMFLSGCIHFISVKV